MGLAGVFSGPQGTRGEKNDIGVYDYRGFCPDPEVWDPLTPFVRVPVTVRDRPCPSSHPGLDRSPLSFR